MQRQKMQIVITDNKKDEVFRMIILYASLKGTTKKQVFREIFEHFPVKDYLRQKIKEHLKQGNLEAILNGGGE